MNTEQLGFFLPFMLAIAAQFTNATVSLLLVKLISHFRAGFANSLNLRLTVDPPIFGRLNPLNLRLSFWLALSSFYNFLYKLCYKRLA